MQVIDMGIRWMALPVLHTAVPEIAYATLKEEIQMVYKTPQALLLDTVQASNCVGQGSRSTVYRIPRLPDYVVQVSHLITPEALKLETPMQDLPDCLPGINIGQPRLSMHDGLVKILYFQSGKTSAIPFQDFFKKYGIDELLGYGISMNIRELLPYQAQHVAHLKLTSSMPQEVYDQLACRIGAIQQAGLFIDPCSLNLLIDKNNYAFGTIDHQEMIGPYENTLGLLCLLMDSMYIDMDEYAQKSSSAQLGASLVTRPDLILVRKQIIKKALIAAAKAGLAWPPEACPKNSFGFYQRSFDMRYIFRISGLSKKYRQVESIFQQDAKMREYHLLDELKAA
jgi:hypothetical protein